MKRVHFEVSCSSTDFTKGFGSLGEARRWAADCDAHGKHTIVRVTTTRKVVPLKAKKRGGKR